MQTKLNNKKQESIFSRSYWVDAANQLKDVRMICIAALIIALRIAVKFFKIQIAPGLNISLDGYINSLGSLIYGPVVGLVVGGISDILGCLVTGQMGQYFPPFALVEMASSFIFGLFFWRRNVSFRRTLSAKFSVNLVCNIIMTSVFNKWMYYVHYGVEKAEAYNIINGARIVKNLILFPFEATLIITIFSLAVPILTRFKLVDRRLCSLVEGKPSTSKMLLDIGICMVLSVLLILFYLGFLKDFVDGLQIKLW